MVHLIDQLVTVGKCNFYQYFHVHFCTKSSQLINFRCQFSLKTDKSKIETIKVSKPVAPKVSILKLVSLIYIVHPLIDPPVLDHAGFQSADY